LAKTQARRLFNLPVTNGGFEILAAHNFYLGSFRMAYTVRSASLDDLPILTAFTLAEARAAEGRELDLERVQSGVRTGLIDHQRARYWVLVDETGNPAGSISVVREWSDWQAGDYWWVQSVYLAPEVRGRGAVEQAACSSQSSCCPGWRLGAAPVRAPG
jgi:hypothetical protein